MLKYSNWDLRSLMLMMGLFMFISVQKHLLSMLLSSEFIVLMLFLLLFIYLHMVNYESYFSMMFLTFTVCEGALGLSILVSLIRTRGNDNFQSFSVKFILFVVFILPICLIINVIWMVQYMLFLISFMLIIFNNYSNFFVNMSCFCCDLLSFNLIMLSNWISSLMLMASQSVFKFNKYKKLFIFNVLLLSILLILAFGNNNLFMFYLFFEGKLILTLFLILGWGYQCGFKDFYKFQEQNMICDEFLLD